jgi:16S rRNA (adenine1518-N6/adenine1519-N6)-dimethyltransferase
MKPSELKKSLGQHFLHDAAMQQKIADAIIGESKNFRTLIEVGPGKGALTLKILEHHHPNYWLVELDNRWAAWLKLNVGKNFSDGKKILNEDFLKISFDRFDAPIHVVGNFPYNISSQIVFKVIEAREKVTALTGMFQKEVALRIAAKPCSKDYGVLSVLTQAYFDCYYLFDVPPQCFTPPPKVMSGVITMRRHHRPLHCNEFYFKKLVKQAFTQRRKTLRNSIKQFLPENSSSIPFLDKRPEQLSVEQFSQLTNECFPSSIKA